MRFAAVLLLGVAACVYPMSGSAQTASTAAGASKTPPVTLQARARLVVVDVVVSGKGNQPVQGLKQTNFTLLEDGKPQSIINFEEHKAATAANKIPPMPKLPAGVFTNYTPAPASAATNILLLDALNTPLADQNYLHQQVLEYLKTPAPSASIAIFGLNQRLIMLQSFSSDPKVLRAAAAKQKGRASPLLGDRVGGGDAGGGPDITSSTFAGGLPSSVQDGLALFQTQTETAGLQLRAQLTLDAVNQLARYLASIPGRKNLIWFSGDFPIDLVAGTSNTGLSPFLDAPAAEQEYRETINLLTRAQVAVYPVDARGVNPVNFVTSTNTRTLAGSGDLDPTATQNAFEHGMMRRMAQDTGGEAFINTNNLAKALNSAITEGSNYYTLTYAPADANWNGRYRKIKVVLDPKEPQLSYRRGYYAADPDSRLSAFAGGPDVGKNKSRSLPPQPETAALHSGMVHGIPTPTQVVFKIRVLPAGTTEKSVAPNNVPTPLAQAQSEEGFTRYVIDFDTEAHDFTFTPRPDGKFDCKIEFAGLVYDPAGRPVNAVSSTLVAALTPQQHAMILQSGMPFRLQLSVPNQGTHTLRIGVEDLISGRTGAIELPVSAVSKLPHVNVPSGAPNAAQPAGARH